MQHVPQFVEGPQDRAMAIGFRARNPPLDLPLPFFGRHGWTSGGVGNPGHHCVG